MALCSAGVVQAQQLNITDFALFSGGSSTCANCAVQIGSASSVAGGSVGSYTAVKSTGTSTIRANVYSGGSVQLANSNIVTGNIGVGIANSQAKASTLLSVGSSASLSGNIDVNGSIVISGGTVSGVVTHPTGTTYTGPKLPAGKEIIGTPSIPTLPQLPAPTTFPQPDPGAARPDITSSQKIGSGFYGAVLLGGNKTLTLNGPGVYVFKYVKNSGSPNSFVFDFQGSSTDTFKIYIEGDADMNKINASFVNGGSASRIYTEVQGTGATSSSGTVAWNIANGSSGKSSKWLGVVYAPFGAINIGSGTGNSDLNGALWSAKGITIQSGVTITYTPPPSDNLITSDYPAPVSGKVNDLLGSELYSLANNPNSYNDVSQTIFIINNGMVMIEVIAQSTELMPRLLDSLQKYGLTGIIDNGPESLTITGSYPIANLLKLDALTDLIDYCHPLYPTVRSIGITSSKGDTAVHADFVRNGYAVSGKGVKIGVLSDSYDIIGTKASIDVSNDDLPGTGNLVHTTPVNVLKEYPFSNGTDEGRAMLQIAHDVAPDAQLGFRTGCISAGDFALGIKSMAESYNVLVDDITHITEPFFQDGVVARAIDSATAHGVSYFSAAGNYGSSSYQGTFNPAPAPSGMTGTAHNFSGTGDIYQSVSLKPGVYTIVLQWQDNFYSLGQTPGAQNDLDIYLADNTGAPFIGHNRNNIGGDPIEVLAFVVSGNAQTNIMIVRAAGSTPVTFKYIVFRGDLTQNEYSNPHGTIVGGANSDSAMTVGAVRYTNTPAFNKTNLPFAVESFSSVGGTPVNGTVRNKPDFIAPDGINTTVSFGSLNLDNDKFPNFFGTSCAAPHAAGVAALLLEAKRKFASQTLKPFQMRTLLQNTALDMGSSGFDYTNGAGFIQAQAALATFANPSPVVTSLVLPNTTIVPGTTAFTVTVQGNYFSNDTKILLRGTALPTTVVSATQITAQVPTFTGNPAIQAYTPPKAINHNDGGLSPSVYFFSIVKRKVVVTATDTTKRYGEKLPVFDTVITVDGVPLKSSGLTLTDVGLDKMTLACAATDLSNTGSYAIRCDTANKIAATSLETYDYTFNNGVLTIQKMPLKITPENKTVAYGAKISGITFTYQYDNSHIDASNQAVVLANLKTAHTANLVDSVIGYVDGNELVSGKTLTAADLQNMSVLATYKTVTSAYKTVTSTYKVVTSGALVTDSMSVVQIDAASIFNYEKSPDTAVLTNSKAVVSAASVVSGTAVINSFKTVTSSYKVVTSGTQIIDSASVSETSNNNTIVIIDSTDLDPSAGAQLDELKAINMVTSFNAGQSLIIPGALTSQNFDVSYGLGSLTILPDAVTVTAKDTFIFQGSPLPGFTSTITGFVNGENPDTTGLKYTLPPTYSGLPGSYTLTPSGLTFTPPNYTVVNYVPGTLYVNPKGGGAKNVSIKLDCVELLSPAYSGRYAYLAHFSYTNPNATTVYVPLGANNLLTGTSFLCQTAQPQAFAPGSGKLAVYFDGQKLTWSLTTYNGTRKTAVASVASSTSSRCTSSLVTNAASSNLQALQETPGEITVYPNPVESNVMISGNGISTARNGIILFDVLGKTHLPRSAHSVSGNSVMLDVGNLSSGVYLIKVKTGAVYKTVRIVKL